MPGGFPLTRHSVVGALAEADPGRRRVAWDELLREYAQPIRRYLRLRFRRSDEDAEDLAQGFLTQAMEKEIFATFDPTKARFRTFLRLCLDRYVIDELAAASAEKRGGGWSRAMLDDAGAEIASPEPDPEELFHREWLRSIFEQSLAALRESASIREKRTRVAIFERYELGQGVNGEPAGRPSYADLAAEFALPVTQITNHLAWARRELRRLVLDELRRSTGSEREFRDEARRALGVEPD